MQDFDASNAQVFGISTDNVPSQKRFAEELKLSFPLLSDFKDREVAKAYGVLRPDGMCNRVSFVVDPDGKIVHMEAGKEAIDTTGAKTACSRLKKH